MRVLSDLGTDECLDVLCEITPSIQSIVNDKSVMEAVGKSIDKEGLTATGMIMAAANKVASAVPLLLKEHRGDVYNIIASIGGLDVADVQCQNILETMRQVKNLLQDKPLLDFFGWSKHGAAKE